MLPAYYDATPYKITYGIFLHIQYSIQSTADEYILLNSSFLNTDTNKHIQCTEIYLI